MSLRQAQLRRCVFYIVIYSIVICIFAGAYRFYYGNSSNFFLSTQPASPYNDYIDQNGNYLSYSGYKILQLISNDISDRLTEVHYYLRRENELKLYFSLVPRTSYHIALVNLKNQTIYSAKQLEILKQEQELLDKEETSTTCTGQSLLLIEKNEIHMKVTLSDTYEQNKLKSFQVRWNENFSELILQQYTSFYITIAYQYKDIPNNEVLNRLNQIIKDWQQFPFEIQLDPIEISSYTNVINYTAILPDVINKR